MSTATYTGTLDPTDDYPEGYLQDIPARDLTADDWNALASDQQALVQMSPLYVFHA